MPGRRINRTQVAKYMEHRKELDQETAAAKAGISPRSARRIERVGGLPSKQEPRPWRTRADPLTRWWDTDVVPLLTTAPTLNAITLLDELQGRYPNEVSPVLLRTLQRRVRQWRAERGGEHEVYFAQERAHDLTQRYEALCLHYGMRASRNNPGASHENGAIEARQGTLKDRLDQALLLRGSRSFVNLEQYRQFVGEAVLRLNGRIAKAFAVERAALCALPLRRTADYEELQARVTKFGTFSVRGVLYSAPSRLIGHRLTVRLYLDRIEACVGAVNVLTLPRAQPGQRRVIDYRRLLPALKRKPGAFARWRLREAMFPRSEYRPAWERLAAELPERQACRAMVGLLDLAIRGA